MTQHVLKVDGAFLLESNEHNDFRGSFAEIWRASDRESIQFVQMNRVRSVGNVVRGLHVSKFDQYKLVQCVHGSIYDVVVDCRKNSRTFGVWDARKLSGLRNRTMLIPPGCAHGFYSYDDSVVVYLSSKYYDASDELTLAWDDASVGIDWVNWKDPLMSPKDITGKSLYEISEALA